MQSNHKSLHKPVAGSQQPVAWGSGGRSPAFMSILLRGSQLAIALRMMPSDGSLLSDLRRFVASHGIEISDREMDIETPGEFDGPTITLNPVHEREALAYYLAHSLGSIYQWSTDYGGARKAFDDLRDAKHTGRDVEFERALEAWQRFEQTSSDHAVWVLDEIGHGWAIRPYTVFFRADIEAMTIFHRTGKEPRWPDFFAEWKRRAERGDIRIEPFRPKPVTRFRPVRIEKQEVVQERD